AQRRAAGVSDPGRTAARPGARGEPRGPAAAVRLRHREYAVAGCRAPGPGVARPGRRASRESGAAMKQAKFYGWRMTLVCLLVQAIAGGISIYLYSLFASEVERAFEAKRATVMLAATGHAVVSALV